MPISKIYSKESSGKKDKINKIGVVISEKSKNKQANKIDKEKGSLPIVSPLNNMNIRNKHKYLKTFK